MTGFVSAGFLVAPRFRRPAYMDAGLLPDEIATMSDCLVDPEPVPGHWMRDPWFGDAGSASAVAASGDVTLLEVAVAADLVPDIRSELGEWTAATGFLAVGGSPSLGPLGFELVGFDSGRWHSWLCLGGLVEEVHRSTGVRPGRHGLIEDASRARLAADHLTSSGLGEPKVYRWFPVRIGSV